METRLKSHFQMSREFYFITIAAKKSDINVGSNIIKGGNKKCAAKV